MINKCLTALGIIACVLAIAVAEYFICITLQAGKPATVNMTSSTSDIIIHLEPGEKLQTINESYGCLHILTRPMRDDESPETYKYHAVHTDRCDIYEIHENR